MIPNIKKFLSFRVKSKWGNDETTPTELHGNHNLFSFNSRTSLSSFKSKYLKKVH